MMDFSEYSTEARRTMNQELSFEEKLACNSLGLAGEAGEVVDYIKKVLYHKHALDTKKLIGELGDVLWYVAAIADTAAIPLDEIVSANIDKLKTRYPNGFDPSRSRDRTK